MPPCVQRGSLHNACPHAAAAHSNVPPRRHSLTRATRRIALPPLCAPRLRGDKKSAKGAPAAAAEGGEAAEGVLVPSSPELKHRKVCVGVHLATVWSVKWWNGALDRLG